MEVVFELFILIIRLMEIYIVYIVWELKLLVVNGKVILY